MSRPQIDDLTWATDDDYTNGIDVGTPTKSTPTAGERAEGFIPDVGADAQVINKVLHDQGAIANYLKDIDWLNLHPINLQAFSDSTLDDGPIGSIGHKPVDTDPYDDHSFLAACVNSTEILYSKDGIYWVADGSAGTFTGVEHPRSLFWSDIASLWILVTNAGATHKILTAPHAPGGSFTWTPRTDPQAGNPSHGAICEAEGIIVCASDNIITSANGTSWTDRGNVTGGSFRSVAYSSALSMFVAVGDNGAIASSPDGVAWTDRTTGAADFRDIVWDAEHGYFLACGNSAQVFRSSNGTSWTNLGLGGTLSDDFTSLATDGGGTVYMTSINLILRSVDGGGSWDVQRILFGLLDPGFCTVLEGRLMVAGGNFGGTSEPVIAMGLRTAPLFAGIEP